MNGLAQALLKLTVPGVPDIYQGTEFWDFSLVDPDNRRPVDFEAAHDRRLHAGSIEDLARTWRSGRLKQALIFHALALRRTKPGLFAEGSYEPLEVSGKLADHVIAFARHLGPDVAITVVPRTPSALLVQREIGFKSGAWKDTSVTFSGNQTFKNIFDRQVFNLKRMGVGQMFERLPFALLINTTVE